MPLPLDNGTPRCIMSDPASLKRITDRKCLGLLWLWYGASGPGFSWNQYTEFRPGLAENLLAHIEIRWKMWEYVSACRNVSKQVEICRYISTRVDTTSSRRSFQSWKKDELELFKIELSGFWNYRLASTLGTRRGRQRFWSKWICFWTWLILVGVGSTWLYESRQSFFAYPVYLQLPSSDWAVYFQGREWEWAAECVLGCFAGELWRVQLWLAGLDTVGPANSPSLMICRIHTNFKLVPTKLWRIKIRSPTRLAIRKRFLL